MKSKAKALKKKIQIHPTEHYSNGHNAIIHPHHRDYYQHNSHVKLTQKDINDANTSTTGIYAVTPAMRKRHRNGYIHEMYDKYDN